MTFTTRLPRGSSNTSRERTQEEPAGRGPNLPKMDPGSVGSSIPTAPHAKIRKRRMEAAHFDDGRCNIPRSIDDFFDTRNAQSDVHAGDTGKVEGLEGHLSPRLSDALSPDGPNCRACTHPSCSGPCSPHQSLKQAALEPGKKEVEPHISKLRVFASAHWIIRACRSPYLFERSESKFKTKEKKVGRQFPRPKNV